MSLRSTPTVGKLPPRLPVPLAGVAHTPEDLQPAPLLRAQDVCLHCGGLAALAGVSFDIPLGESLVLSALNCLNGFYYPHRGQIHCGSHDPVRVPTHQVPQFEITRTFPNNRPRQCLGNAPHPHATEHAGECARFWLCLSRTGRAPIGRGLMGHSKFRMLDRVGIWELYLGFTHLGERKGDRRVRHYNRRKGWLG